ncbi:tRNA epoxyqueuosine(34) reductase QueG [Pacificimonas sp. WHA3]|uniref:Epoxyqueuosine reductase n=1 Tax=Pacificimonas pallii TaxID=2827236 RepID=A0ABS6SBM0_9SPHN|nr:tRNA epoxyqueuosine(34) reductase QueG [Pacificimonas pallii]MBV7255818.1 tRNA epoxyqueuosine(34) reductase QueG [Pacificimonas pallii]
MRDNKVLSDPLPALRAESVRQGFSAFGVAPMDAAPQAGARLRQWLNEGMHGNMLWMEEKADRRRSPRALWPDVRSVIMLGMSYAPALDPLRHADNADIGVLSVYAHGGDYHDIVKRRLKAVARWIVAQAPDSELKIFVDTAPVMEKPLAEAAGLGWQGKHTNIVSAAHGSWLFLGSIYTTLSLAVDAPHADRCGSCSACQTACPTDAFPTPYRLDARRCISYLTIEHAGPIPHEFRRAMGNRIYGCDDCLAVCPWNKFAERSREMMFAPRPALTRPRLADLAQLDDADFRNIFAGSPVKRIGRERFVRNVAIALGNQGDAAAAAALRPLAGDASPVVAEAARWALGECGAAV